MGTKAMLPGCFLIPFQYSRIKTRKGMGLGSNPYSRKPADVDYSLKDANQSQMPDDISRSHRVGGAARETVGPAPTRVGVRNFVSAWL